MTLDRRRRPLVIAGAIVGCLAIVALAVVFASAEPDGLEYVSEQQAFAEQAEDSAAAGSPFADYGFGGDGVAGGVLAGAVGLLITFVIMGGGVLLLTRRSRRARRHRPAAVQQ